MTKSLQERIVAIFEADLPLDLWPNKLREFKKEGFKQRDVLDIFETLRTRVQSEEDEDFILDIMDFVVGFCHPNYQVWNSW